MKSNKFILGLGIIMLLLSNILAFLVMKLNVIILDSVTGGFAYNSELWLENSNNAVVVSGAVIVLYQLFISVIANIKAEK